MKAFLRPDLTRLYAKICGLGSVDDIRVACAAGADACGFVTLSDGSPRNLDPKRVAELVREVPRGVASVLVTRDLDPWRVGRIAEAVRPDAVQIPFAAGVSAAKRLRDGGPGVTVIFSLPVEGDDVVANAERAASAADFVLLDTGTGGTGTTHDWELSRAVADSVGHERVVLAGGLTPENVLEAANAMAPHAVDVSSGVESAPGRKDHGKVQRFLAEVKRYRAP